MPLHHWRTLLGICGLNIVTILIGVSSAVFLFYGILCLTSLSMLNDFQRYGLANLRTLTGVLELCGGIGLLDLACNPEARQPGAELLALRQQAGRHHRFLIDFHVR